MIKETDLLRYLEGQCTPDEAAAIQRWMVADSSRVALVDDLRKVWAATGPTRTWNVAAARERLRRAGAGAPSIPTPVAQGSDHGRETRARTGSGRWLWPARVAVACLAVAVGLTLAYRPSKAPAFREYATMPGQRAELTLSDGSRVMLSVDSRLRVPREFGSGTRTVELTGEAYFVVRHDARRPFEVRTAHGIARDLGTSFDVRAYPEERGIQVVVAEGLVALSDDRGDTTLLLRPRDRGHIDARGTVSKTTPVALDQHLSWTRGALAFRDAPADSVVAELRRWYDLDLSLDGGVAGSRFGETRITITFDSASSGEALTALAEVLAARIIRTDNVVRLTPIRSRSR